MALFRYRSDRGLEVEAVFRLRAPPDLSVCSEQTQEVGFIISNAWYDGIFLSLDLLNMRPFWTKVVLGYVENGI